MSIILMSLLYTGKHLPPAFFFLPLFHSLSVGEFKTGRIRMIQIIFKNNFRRIQERAKLFASEITLYTCTLPELWQIFKVWILKDFNLVYKL